MSFFRVPWPVLLALCACAQQPMGPSAPVCDGHHRRPANPYGSVLTPTPPPAPTMAVPQAAAPGGFASCP